MCICIYISSVQFSHSVVSDSSRPHEPQNARPPCPSPTPKVYPNSCPLSQWCHPTISPSVVPFSSCLQFSQHQCLFKWVSSLHQVAKTSLEFQLQHQSFQWTPIQDWSPLRWTGWISLQSKGLSRSSPTPQFKSINSSALSFLYSLSHPYMTTGKTIALTRWTLSIKPPIFIHVVANGKKILMAEYYSYISISISLHIHLLMDT